MSRTKDIAGMNEDFAKAKRAKMAAEQAVSRMDGRLRYKLKPHVRQGLVDAILKSEAQDDLLFRNTPARFTPSAWSITGLLSRLALIWNRRNRGTWGTAEDQRAALSETHARVRQSGAAALVIAFAVALLAGAIELAEPLEIGGQTLRDATRRTAASGDIVVIAKDDRSAQQFGAIPWARRHDAALIDKLREMGAKTIAMDDIFSALTNPVDDRALAAAFDRAGGKVWLSVGIEKNMATEKQEPWLPAPLFAQRTQQAHFWFWLNMFGHIKAIPESIMIAGNSYPSLAGVLATGKPVSGDLLPDYAINYRTIPTISAGDILLNRVDRSLIAGKTVIIGALSETRVTMYPIAGYERASAVYSLVVGAETINRGVVRLGYLPPLLMVLIIGLILIFNRSRKQRAIILGAGALALIAIILIGDRAGWHFLIIPALLLLIIIAVREAIYGKLIVAETTNQISGLPNLSEIYYIKGREASAVGALKIEQYADFVAPLSREAQRILINGIAARVNIMCPDSIVHQGDDGLFVWLISPGSECDLDVVGGQINALFMVPVVGLHGMHDVGVSLGIIKDMSLNFRERLVVAIDRAKVPVYVTLREVL
jgi:CHASE2 domain-containing sensor protein